MLMVEVDRRKDIVWRPTKETFILFRPGKRYFKWNVGKFFFESSSAVKLNSADGKFYFGEQSRDCSLELTRIAIKFI